MSSEMNEKGDDSDQSMDLSEETILDTNNQNNQDGDLYFDAIIGHIEDLIMDDKFQCLQNNFLDKYWMEFENLDENKFIYMDIFKEYTETIENYIDTHLTNKIQGFNMEDFLRTFEDRYANNTEIENELEGEIFEMLFTFTDFLRFKQMFLDYRAMKEGKYEDFSSGILVTSVIPTVESDECIV